MEPWLHSDKSHERRRAAQTTFLLLQYTVDYVMLTVSVPLPCTCGEEGRGLSEGRSKGTPQGPPASCWTRRSSQVLQSLFTEHPVARHGAGGRHKGPVVSLSWGRGCGSNSTVREIVLARLPRSKDLEEGGERDWGAEGAHSGPGNKEHRPAEMLGPGRREGQRRAGAWGGVSGPRPASPRRPPQEEATPSLLGHQLGLLALLWRDKDPVTRSHCRQSIYLLLQLLIQQKGEWSPRGAAATRVPAS